MRSIGFSGSVFIGTGQGLVHSTDQFDCGDGSLTNETGGNLDAACARLEIVNGPGSRETGAGHYEGTTAFSVEYPLVLLCCPNWLDLV